MTSPYINTKLSTKITLYPDQMDNKLYINLKKNLEKKLLNKCYKNYGYIKEIYEIINFSSGLLEAENLMASAIFDVEFSCRVCYPLLNKKLVCQLDRVNKVLITADNGPILVLITNDRINDKLFFIDNNNNIRYKTGNDSKTLKSKDFVVVIVTSMLFNNGDDRIKVIGVLDDVATDNEIEHFYKELYNKEVEVELEHE